MNIFGRIEQKNKVKSISQQKEIASKKYSNYSSYEKDMSNLEKTQSKERYARIGKELTTKTSGGAVNTLGNNLSSLSKERPKKVKKSFKLSL